MHWGLTRRHHLRDGLSFTALMQSVDISHKGVLGRSTSIKSTEIALRVQGLGQQSLQSNYTRVCCNTYSCQLHQVLISSLSVFMQTDKHNVDRYCKNNTCFVRHEISPVSTDSSSLQLFFVTIIAVDVVCSCNCCWASTCTSTFQQRNWC